MFREPLIEVWGKRKASEKQFIMSPHAPNGANCPMGEKKRRVREEGRGGRERPGGGGDDVVWAGGGGLRRLGQELKGV